MQNKFQNYLANLPISPGVYIFSNIKNEIIYVGKAKNLRKRVSSYFNKNRYENAKLRTLVSRVNSIDHIIVNSESDALLLENNLIKKHKPKYNILLKDDKTYPWICVKNEEFPRVFSTRKVVQDGSRYFGPYTSGLLVKTLLELFRSMYPLRTCNLKLTQENISKGKFKPCLEFQLGNCLAPCVANQNEIDYQKSIDSVVNILKGNVNAVHGELKKQMFMTSKLFKFEEAQEYKNKIDIIERFQSKTTIVNQGYKDLDVYSIYSKPPFHYVNYLKIVNGSIIQSHNIELKKVLNETQEEMLGFAIAEIKNRTGSSAREIVTQFIPEFKIEGCRYHVPNRGDKLKLLDLSLRNAKAFALERNTNNERNRTHIIVERLLSTIKTDLNLTEFPSHIECFDNSNLQGTNPVAACVVFRNARPSKNEYRHFNIKTVDGPNDFASMYEVVKRRYKRLISENLSLPQLIVIDGGKGQLNYAYTAIKELQIEQKVKIIGIAKKLEEIFTPNDTVPLYLDKNSETLKVIQHIRNEAHRFGIKHHRNRRIKSVTKSKLEEIAGVGHKTIEKLLKKYKTTEALKDASLSELKELVGDARARLIVRYFQG
ncbi:MAG TPA: excinuclease ABC subunit UvrC [Tenuifilaceae bacterium]|nr:excinuclease ABC subunit UvrC [Tenuifilaceae bacterium]HPQ32862.1 excinuclease ABC subunit UvrC [Tenuifilaceae bacterium]